MKILGLLLLTCLVLPPSQCAPFRDEGPDVQSLSDGMHNHSDPYRDARFFQNNNFGMGDIDISGHVKGDHISIGSGVNIDLKATDSQYVENPSEPQGETAESDLVPSNKNHPDLKDGADVENGTNADITRKSMPKGPQGPVGAILHYDLLSNNQVGLDYPEQADVNYLGAFVPREKYEPQDGSMESYVPSAAHQDPETNKITITAERLTTEGAPKITSAWIDTKEVWTTAQSPEIKNRGYLEVRALMPASSDAENFSGAFPAIRLLGADGQEWPDSGEIEVAKLRNGEPTVHMALQSTNNHGVNGQNPPNSPIQLLTNMTKIPVIFGLEWNIKADDGQIDLTWYITSFDVPSEEWISHNFSKSLLKSNGEADDFSVFSKSFSGEGFYLVINLAQGGHFTEVNQESDLLVDGPQRIVIESAKVYRMPDEQAWNSLVGGGCDTGLTIGTTVVRNDVDWKWGYQDGGAGSKGTIVSLNRGWGWIGVRWFNGNENSYRFGAEGKADIKVYCPGNCNTAVRVGAKVVRDEINWPYGNQDGGLGSVGTITGNALEHPTTGIAAVTGVPVNSTKETVTTTLTVLDLCVVGVTTVKISTPWLRITLTAATK